MSNSSASQPSIYKTEAAKAALMALYDAKLKHCNLPVYKEEYIETTFGQTHVILAGEEHLPPVVLLHGINAGAPMALEAMRSLVGKYRIFAVDTVGQATKSAENRPSMTDNSYGKWLSEVLGGLKLESLPVIGVSYGAFLLQRLIVVDPSKVTKAIFVVPSGLVNGNPWVGFTKLMFPLMRFQVSKKEKHLIRFMKAFYLKQDAYSIEFQKLTLTGLKMDYRRPPLLQEAEVAGFKAPVYAMVAEDDVFFPGEKALARLKSCFPTLKESITLKGAKHIPDESSYPLISGQLDQWLSM
jgi:pimeloyl-ACP methyl ester carboxylesterase